MEPNEGIYMPNPRQTPTVFKYETPRYFYVLRKWFDDAIDNTSTCSQVVVISSNGPLDRTEVKQRLEELEVGQCDEFVLVDVSPESSVILDTWDPGIEGMMHPDMDTPGRCYRNWWSADDCTAVEA
jgi:hypothetical protein